MRLLRLSLKNFKGIKDFTLDIDGNDASVFADNAVGKTTIFDAFLWLLFGKDSQNKKDFEIKTLDAAGKAISGLEHEVEGVFEVNGRRVTLRKSYYEKWTKKRGAAKAEFTGHTTDHFIDGVPCSQREYAGKIAEIASEDIFRLLTDPTFFNEQLHWQKRREIIMEVCGDISDAEVIASNKDLAKLPEVLGDRKLEDHRKVIAARRAELNKELEKIPVRIDEVMRGLPDITGLDADKLQEANAVLKQTRANLQEQLLQVQSGGEIARKKVELQDINAELMRLRNEHQAGIDAQVSGKRSALSEAESRCFSLKRQIADLTTDATNRDRKIINLKTKADSLRTTWGAINQEQLVFQQETTCPTCGQDIPEEKLAEARETAEANFNREKAGKLEAITAEGKAIMAEVEELERLNTEALAQTNELKSQLEATEQEVNRLRGEIEAIQSTCTSVESNPEYMRKMQEKAALEAAITNLQAGNSEAANSIKREIDEINQEIQSNETFISQIEQYKKGQARIEELKALEKQLASEYEKLEGELFLTEQFIRTKVKMLEEKINSRFKYARFKLFDVQVNGGIQECCETLYKGVPYSTNLNSAARINVGLDIINTLSEHYGFSAPIFVDNSEAVTRLINTKAQVVKLVVSEPDKVLRVEVESNRKAEVA